jgi:hypothetical protein
MSAAIPIEQLEVIGYAESLGPAMVPSIVPPVFRFRSHPDRALLPPFSLSGGFVCGATVVSDAEIRELRDAGELFLFESSYAARPDFELWIDERFRDHYDSRASVRRILQDFARQSITQAKTALADGDTAGAERLCSMAISADERCIDAFVLKAAIRRKEGNADGERLMARLVLAYLDPASFRRLVDGCLIRQPEARPPVVASPTRDIALCKAA